MKPILTILIIAFYSCTSSGKLIIDSEFNKSGKVNITTSPAGLSEMTTTYNGSATIPTNVGSYSYTITPTFINYKKMQDDTVKYALIFAGIALSILLAVFLFIRKRDEEITMPDDEDDNFPPLDNAFGINNSIFKL